MAVGPPRPPCAVPSPRSPPARPPKRLRSTLCSTRPSHTLCVLGVVTPGHRAGQPGGAQRPASLTRCAPPCPAQPGRPGCRPAQPPHPPALCPAPGPAPPPLSPAQASGTPGGKPSAPAAPVVGGGCILGEPGLGGTLKAWSLRGRGVRWPGAVERPPLTEQEAGRGLQSESGGGAVRRGLRGPGSCGCVLSACHVAATWDEEPH